MRAIPDSCSVCEHSAVKEGKSLTEIIYFLCLLTDRDMHSLYDFEHDIPDWCPLKALGRQRCRLF